MQVEQLSISPEKCKSELKAFKNLVKTHRKSKIQQVHRDLHRVYGHMQHGGKAINLIESFKKVGVNENFNPKLAICRADGKICYCYKNPDGSAVFSFARDIQAARKSYRDVGFPIDTFKFLAKGETWINWEKRQIATPVPIIPASILNPINQESEKPPIKYGLNNYHIIWEVEKWKRVPPRDPILVKLINGNVALVLAHWDLTELERAVIQGRL